MPTTRSKAAYGLVNRGYGFSFLESLCYILYISIICSIIFVEVDMSVLKGVLIEELDRIKKNIDSYESLLLSLPRGYLFEQIINGKPYCYRKHREGSMIVSFILL